MNLEIVWQNVDSYYWKKINLILFQTMHSLKQNSLNMFKQFLKILRIVRSDYQMLAFFVKTLRFFTAFSLFGQIWQNKVNFGSRKEFRTCLIKRWLILLKKESILFKKLLTKLQVQKNWYQTLIFLENVNFWQFLRTFYNFLIHLIKFLQKYQNLAINFFCGVELFEMSNFYILNIKILL